MSKITEWLKRIFRPKGKLSGPAGGPRPGPSSTSDDDRE